MYIIASFGLNCYILLLQMGRHPMLLSPLAPKKNMTIKAFFASFKSPPVFSRFWLKLSYKKRGCSLNIGESRVWRLAGPNLQAWKRVWCPVAAVSAGFRTMQSWIWRHAPGQNLGTFKGNETSKRLTSHGFLVELIHAEVYLYKICCQSEDYSFWDFEMWACRRYGWNVWWLVVLWGVLL